MNKTECIKILEQIKEEQYEVLNYCETYIQDDGMPEDIKRINSKIDALIMAIKAIKKGD